MASNNLIKPQFDYLPLSIRLQTNGGIATPMILRGTPLPTKRSMEFSTASDNQTQVEIFVCLGESPLTINNQEMGKFVIKDIPPAKCGEPKVYLEFNVNKDYSIIIKAKLNGSLLNIEKSILPPSTLTDDYIKSVLDKAEKTRESDEKKLQQIEIVNRSKNLINEAEEIISGSPNPSIDKAVAELGLALASGDYEKIQEKESELKKIILTSNSTYNDLFNNLFNPPSNNFRPRISNKQSQVKTKKPIASRSLQVGNNSPLLGKIFGGQVFTIDPQLCFVIMPFSDKFHAIYMDHIKPAVIRSGLICKRSDEIHSANLITHDIWEYINRSRLLIAELTDRNPNVFYELGLAHALSKDVILLTQSMDYVPFDLKPIRCICYENTEVGINKLENALIKTINKIVRMS